MPTTLHQTHMLFSRQSYQHWISSEIFSFPWWFNIIFLAIVYIIWLKLVDKNRLRHLLLFGSMLGVTAGFVDIIATTMGLWEYKIRLLPIQPATFPFDYTVLPILYMLVLQYTSSWKNYLIGSFIASSLFAFVISPIYILLQIKEYHNFNYFYMFLLVFLVTTFLKAVYNWITNIEQEQQATNKEYNYPLAFQPALKYLDKDKKN